MDEILHTLKLGLAAHLEKQGSSLEEFEKSLSSLNEAQGAVKVAETITSFVEMQKEAFWPEAGKMLTGAAGLAGGALTGLAEGGLTSAMIVGSMGGAGAYGLKKYMENEDKDINAKQDELNRVKSLTDRLRQDYGLHSHKA